MKKQEYSWSSVVFFVILTQVLLLSPSSIYEPRLKINYPTKADIVLENFKIVEVPLKGGKVEIKAGGADIYQGDNLIFLNVLEGYIENPNGSYFGVEAERGKYFSNKQDLQIENKVLMTLDTGYQLETDYMEYIHNEKRVRSPSMLQFQGPNPKQPQIIVVGQGVEGDVSQGEYQILRDIKCERRVFNDLKQTYNITSETLMVYPNQKKALFEGNVNITQKDFHMTAKKYEIYFQEKNNEPDKAIASGDVLLWQGNRRAEAKEAVFLTNQNKLVLRGNPKAYVGENVLRGKIIIFHTGSQKIESYNVEGEYRQKS